MKIPPFVILLFILVGCQELESSPGRVVTLKCDVFLGNRPHDDHPYDTRLLSCRGSEVSCVVKRGVPSCYKIHGGFLNGK